MSRLFLRSSNIFFALLFAFPVFGEEFGLSAEQQIRRFFKDQLGVTVAESLELIDHDVADQATNGVLEAQLGFVLLGSGHICRYGTGHRYMSRFAKLAEASATKLSPI